MTADNVTQADLVVASLLQRVGQLDAKELLRAVIAEFEGRIAVTSSFGTESAVLLDLVAQVAPATPVLFIDTGELFDETLEYRYQLERQLKLEDVRVVRPTEEERKEAEELWTSDSDRCCLLRKVRPLARATQGFAALIDGRKRAHGAERAELPPIAAQGGVVKVSPLANWGEDEVERAFRERGLPRHPLLEQGYRSVGCWPCTRPTKPGESPRAGRWAGSAKTECGLHTAQFAIETELTK